LRVAKKRITLSVFAKLITIRNDAKRRIEKMLSEKFNLMKKKRDNFPKQYFLKIWSILLRKPFLDTTPVPLTMETNGI